MRFRTSTFCPHCHRPIKLFADSSKLYSEGCPIKKCPRCHGAYLDRHCKEQAFKPYRKIHYLANLLRGVYFAFLIAVALFMMVKSMIPTSTFSEYAIAIMIACYVLPAGSFFGLFCWLEHRNAAKSKKLWEESDQRLKNTDYAKMLANARFKVPSHYLPRGFKRQTQPLDFSKCFQSFYSDAQSDIQRFNNKL